MTVSSRLDIHLLGPFRVLIDGHAIEDQRWPRRKAKSLLKNLALQPHHQLHREELMEILWPDLDIALAVANLDKIIHHTRRVLEPDLRTGTASRFILRNGTQITLAAQGGLFIDVEKFEEQAKMALRSQEPEAYESALLLYTGDLLPEDPYEEWATVKREELRFLKQDLLFSLAAKYEDGLRYQRGIATLKLLIALDQTNEEVHRRLMRLYAMTGGLTQALQQYQQCCDALKREIDAAPEPETVKLSNDIRTGLFPPALDRKSGVKHQLTTVGGLADEQEQRDSREMAVAILPFVNARSHPELDYLADGITESLIQILSRLSGLRVIARSTVFRYKAQEVDPLVVGRELNVQAVVTGRVDLIENRLLVGAELVDSLTGHRIWGEHYRRNFSGIFVLQEEISTEISEKLKINLSGDQKKQISHRHTNSSQAYQLYLHGRHFWNKRTEADLDKSISYFREAIKTDSDYALAYVGLADAYNVLGVYGALPAEEVYTEANSAALRALELDEGLAEAHTSLAHTKASYEWNWDEAERAFRRAIELNPNYGTARQWYSEFLSAMRRFEESFAEIEAALALDPLSLSIITASGNNFYYARDYDRAIEQYCKAVHLNSYFVQAHFNLGRAFNKKGQYADSVSAYQRALELCAGAVEKAALGQAYAVSGRRNVARKMLQDLLTVSKRQYISPYYMALTYTGLGDKRTALEWLEKAYEERANLLFFLRAEPMFDSLHTEQRFRDLVRRIGHAPV